MNDKRPICGLITDFGNRDYFVGVLKGVMRQITPGLELIDICNEIPPYSLLSASFTLEKSVPYFPSGTIFLVVVDPGVGTERRILLVEQGGKFFVAPDNGALTPVLEKEEKRVWTLDKKKYFLIDGHSTFEARDKMSPAAAYLAAGVDPGEMGTPVTEFVVNREFFPGGRGGGIDGRVVYIDRFGNIMTNVSREFLFASLKASGLSRFKAECNGREISGFYRTYAQAGPKPFMLIGSHQNLEFAMNQQSATAFLQTSVGEPVRINFF